MDTVPDALPETIPELSLKSRRRLSPELRDKMDRILPEPPCWLEAAPENVLPWRKGCHAPERALAVALASPDRIGCAAEPFADPANPEGPKGADALCTWEVALSPERPFVALSCPGTEMMFAVFAPDDEAAEALRGGEAAALKAAVRLLMAVAGLVKDVHSLLVPIRRWAWNERAIALANRPDKEAPEPERLRLFARLAVLAEFEQGGCPPTPVQIAAWVSAAASGALPSREMLQALQRHVTRRLGDFEHAPPRFIASVSEMLAQVLETIED